MDAGYASGVRLMTPSEMLWQYVREWADKVSAGQVSPLTTMERMQLEMFVRWIQKPFDDAIRAAKESRAAVLEFRERAAKVADDQAEEERQSTAKAWGEGVAKDIAAAIRGLEP